MSYRLGPQNQVLHVESGASLPCRFENGQVVALDEHSPFVKEFAAWAAAGNTPEPAPKPDPKDAIKAQLVSIDSATGSVRWVRELALGVNDIIAALQAGPLPSLPSAGSGMAKVKAIEDQAAALRKQLAALP